MQVIVSPNPKVITNGLTLSIVENTGVTAVAKNTKPKFDVKSASCFN